MSAKSNPRVGLFVTCLVDAIRPGIGFAAIQLLEEAGCRVEVPQAQTCCGQPALNSGDVKDAADLARRTIAAIVSRYSSSTAAVVGMAMTAPITPKSMPPMMADSTTSAPGTFTVRRMTLG